MRLSDAICRWAVVVFLILFAISARTAMAGQVVIQFAARIDQLQGSIGSVPTPLAVGDTILGQCVFDSSEFDAHHTATIGSPRLFLGDSILQSSNSAGLVLNEGLNVPPTNPPPDTLLIQCSSPTNVFPSCNSNRFPENENLIWDPTLTIFADAGAFQTLADVRSLSNLSSIGGTGQLRIRISQLNPAQASLEHLLTIQATVTDFTALPEPGSFILGVFASSIAIAGFSTRFERGKQ